MGMAPEASVRVVDFNGLIDNVDPRDLPPGAATVQVNATCVKVGELQIRQGLREITFDSE